MAATLFPKKKAVVTYGRRSGKVVSVLSRPTVVSASNAGLASASSKESLDDDDGHGDVGHSGASDDDLPSIEAAVKKPSRGTAHTSIEVATSATRKPSAKALGKRRAQDDDLPIEDDSTSAEEQAAGTGTAGRSRKATKLVTSTNYSSPRSTSHTKSKRQKTARSRSGSPDAPPKAKAAPSDGARRASIKTEDRGDPEYRNRSSSPFRKASPPKAEATSVPSPSRSARSDNRQDAPKRPSRRTSPAVLVLSPSPSKRQVSPPLPSPTRTERAVSMSPPPSPPDSPIDLPEPSLGFGFDELLGPPVAHPAVRKKKTMPQRDPLVRQMSARSEADSDGGGSIFSSPRRTPNVRSRAGSESYFDGQSPPKRPASPLRSLQASLSAPEVDTGTIFASRSRSRTPDISVGPKGTSPARAPPASPPAAIKRTYGQHRTIISDIDITNPLADIQAASRLPLLGVQSQSYGSLSQGASSYGNSAAPSEQGDDEDEEDDDGEEDLLDSQSNMNNINQLRSAGENRRFTDELNYMLEGFDVTQSVGIQRASAIEVIRKLRDEDWVRKLRTYDFVLKVYDSFLAVKAGDGDRVLGTCLVIFLSRLVQDATSAELLLQYKPQDEGSTSCLDLIRRVFQTKWAKSDLGGSDRSVSKSEARLLGALHDIITSDQKDTKHKISVRFLIYNILAGIAIHKLPSPHSPYEVVWTSSFRDAIVETLDLNLQNSTDSGFPDKDTVEIDVCLRLLESGVADMPPSTDPSELDSLATKLSRGVVVLVAVSERAAFADDDEEEALSASGLLTSALKLLVTACTLSKAWAEAVVAAKTPLLQHLVQIVHLTRHAEPSSPDVQSQDGNTSTQSSANISSNGDAAHPTGQFDLLCLSLGLLETLLDTVMSGRSTFRAIRLAHSSAIEAVSKVYAELKLKVEQPEKQILAKLCFLILLHTMLGHEPSQEEIGRVLQGTEIGPAPFVEELKSLQATNESADDSTAQVQVELSLAVAKLESFVQ